MSIFAKIWKALPIWHAWNFASSWIGYAKSKKYVSETFYSNAFKLVIKKYLGINLKEDWLGRLYGVANPSIKDGKFDITTMVIEIDGDNTNNNEQVKNWAFKQLQMVAELFKIEKLYDYISLEFKHVGPEEFDNYLFIFDISARKVFANAIKGLIKNLAIWGILCGALAYMQIEFGAFNFLF